MYNKRRAIERETKSPLRECSTCKKHLPINAFYRKGDGLAAQCKNCISEYNRRKIESETPEQKKQKHERTKNWRLARLEEERERSRNYHHQNRARILEQKREYTKNHKEQISVRVKAWRSANRDRKNITEAVRVQRIRANGGSFTVEEWLALCAHFFNRCLSCGKECALHIDHVIPVSKGGTSDISNLQPLCRSCNSTKATNDTDYRLKPHPNCLPKAIEQG